MSWGKSSMPWPAANRVERWQPWNRSTVMAKKDDDFLQKLLVTFRAEADEHLKTMSSSVLELEKSPTDARRAALIETIFREAHSLKGAARAVNFSDIESACQSLETVFAGMKSGASTSAQLLDLLHQVLEALDRILVSAPSPTGTPTLTNLIRRLEGARQAPPSPGREEIPPPPPSIEPAEASASNAAEPLRTASETVRIAGAKLDAVMRQAEELLAARLAAGERARELREFVTILDTQKKRPADSQTALRTLADRLSGFARSAEGDHRALTTMVDNLLNSVKEMQLLPLASLLDSVPRIVREIARDSGKQVQVVVHGGEIEIDRRILEELKDPLIHLLRNCVDHGIETPALRKQRSKPAHGTIAIAISQKDGGKIEVAVADDGAGVDVANLRTAAAKLGALATDDVTQLGEEEALALVFRSGVSTSPIITDLSGRGLGLAIVHEKIGRLGGTIALETRVGTGTTFRIALPLTLATFRGILVRVGEQLFVIPAVGVERVVRVVAEDIRTLENRETISLGSQAVPLAQLGDALELPRRAAASGSDTILALVLGSGFTRIAFQVDEILGEQEVLVKTLGAQLARVRNVVGAAVLGTGQVAPVLNVADLLKSATKLAAAPRTPGAIDKPAEIRKRAVLVVEDSITSRSLLKNILESAGYSVTAAVDGIDGYTALKSATFDLVVSDVEMPRMDGFDLTARIRADKHLSELPVVLVTALEQREHRERGIEVGASAYIVKSSFDQSNLLEVVRRLMS